LRRAPFAAGADVFDMRDKSYREFPVGQEWGRFLRAKRLEGDAPATISSYETVGRMLALRYPDFESLEPFTDPERVLDFIEKYWATPRSPPAFIASRPGLLL
jgi:hypothetical protein